MLLFIRSAMMTTIPAVDYALLAFGDFQLVISFWEQSFIVQHEKSESDHSATAQRTAYVGCTPPDLSSTSSVGGASRQQLFTGLDLEAESPGQHPISFDSTCRSFELDDTGD